MILGERVEGLMMNRHWRFVVSDLMGIASQVRQYDPRGDVRLAAHEQTQEIAVMQFVRREHLGDLTDDDVQAPMQAEGGAWLLAFQPKNPDGTKMVGEPDSSVLTQMRARDQRLKANRVNATQILDEMEKLHETREVAAMALIAEKLVERTARRMHTWAKKSGTPWAPGRIFVPRGTNDGGR